jgi:hypothetical protein
LIKNIVLAFSQRLLNYFLSYHMAENIEDSYQFKTLFIGKKMCYTWWQVCINFEIEHNMVQNVCGEQQNNIIDVHDVHVGFRRRLCWFMSFTVGVGLFNVLFYHTKTWQNKPLYCKAYLP